jgi:hypothetical protein
VPAKPYLTASPATTDFGTVAVGSSASASIITITNTGTGSTGTLALVLGGDSAASFTISGNTCSTSLGVGQSCLASVTFVPAAVGSASAYLTVSDGNVSVSTKLSGTVPGKPYLTASPATTDFGTVAVGNSASASITITNTGTGATGTLALALGVDSAASFTISANTCSSSLGAGQSCMASVTFLPVVAGSASAYLTASDGNVSVSPKLAGTGAASKP